MKKLAVLLLVSLFAPNVFALSAAEKALAADVQKAVEQANAQAVKQNKTIAQLQERLADELAYFKKFAYNYAYYDYSMLFQGMDGVRKAYIALREASKEAARQMAPKVNEAIDIDKGKRQLRIADYVRMESCMIGSYSAREAALWDAWSAMLEEDLKAQKAVSAKPAVVTADTPLAEGLPVDFAKNVQSFRYFVGRMQGLNANWVLQSMMGAMDSFNANLKKNPQAAEAMAKEFVKPVKTGWGRTLSPVAFINDHACELYGPVQNDLYQFAADLQRLSR